ncbi:fimbrillin family protein [uncultured Bacteroides sp.]|uniref:fimbrillin family protein n=1 Tax=uncultured Bacteroides sp. TaxID=162156 RepID=UPI00280B4016|nr:fimbrillin family protein [uncultured Bacteroides sp.]
MKNILKFSFIAMTVAACMAGCNQNDEPVSVSGRGDVMSVTVTASDFTPTDADTRISTGTNHQTVFQENDRIGIYAFVTDDTGTEIVCKNLPLIRNAQGGWDGTIYNYTGATYFAYSPYDKDFSNQLVLEEQDIIDLVMEKVKATVDQSNIETYNSLDLMTAIGVKEGNNITFNFEHKMSMIELAIPVAKFRTMDNAGDAACFHYTAPVEVALELFSGDTPGTNAATPKLCSLGGGLYRYILTPGSNISAKGTLYYRYDDSGSQKIPVEFTTGESGELVAGSYKGWNVSYDGVASEEVVRPIEVGDYYYADGSIFPVNYNGFGENPLKDGCIGIIFSTETSEADKENGWNNGYVMALTDTDDNSNISNGYKWASSNDQITNLELHTGSKESGTSFFQGLIDYMDGYTDTQNIIAYIDAQGKDYSAFEQLANYKQACPVPDATSGWYMPSIGQFAAVINNLGAPGENDKKFTSGNAMEGISGGSGTKFDENHGATDAMKKLQVKLEKAGGKFHFIEKGSYGYRWWTSTPDTDSNVWSIDMNGFKFLMYSCSKGNSSNMHVRPVLAF